MKRIACFFFLFLVVSLSSKSQYIIQPPSIPVKVRHKSSNQNKSLKNNNRKQSSNQDIDEIYEKGATLFEQGKYKDAVNYFRIGASRNDAYSCQALGRCYYLGLGVNQNFQECVKLYEKAARKNDDWAEYDLSMCYIQGKGVSQDYTMAFYWGKKAALQGNSEALALLGLLYENGNGVGVNEKEAIYWYTLAAEKNNTFAQERLLKKYFDPKGSQNYSEGFKWAKIVAEKNINSAQFLLGLCYYHGLGTSVDMKAAYYWMQKAAENGSTSAIDFINERKFY